MAEKREFTGQSDPRQHLIDLGIPADFVDMLRVLLSKAETLDETRKIIRSGEVNTALGGTQLTSPLVRALYQDDPLVRQEFKENLVQYGLPDEVLNTYFSARQYGWMAVMVQHRDVVDRVGKERMTEFVGVADKLAYNFLREYFGCTTNQEAK